MSWDEQAATWDDDPAVQAYSRAALRSLLHLLETRGRTLDGARVLDFGCGTGLLTTALAKHAETVVGLDISAPMVAKLADKHVPNVTALCGTPDEHPLGRFDLITCSSVCAFLEDYDSMVETLVAHLNPGGYFVQWDWELDASADEPFGLSRDQIHQALQAAGLRDITVKTGFEEPFEGHTMAPVMGVGTLPD